MLLLVALALPLAVLDRGAAATPGPPGSVATFSDVPVAHPFFVEIEWMVAEGITTGYADGTFRPSWIISRQAMAAFLHRLAGRPAFTPPATPTFTDVGPTHPFRTEIEWAAAQGITTGYPDGTFRPVQPISRQAMAALLHRLAGRPAFTPPATPTFPDVGTTHPFRTEIEWSVAHGVATGYADGTFKPGVSISRQASAAFLFRYDHRVRPRPWSPPRQLSHATVGDLLSDGVAAAGPDGSVHVAWKEDDRLLYRKLDAAGNTMVRTVDLQATPVQARAYAMSDLTLAPRADGGVVVLWRYSVGAPQSPGIYGMVVDPAGRPELGPVRVAAGFYAYLSAAVDDDGFVHLAALEAQTSTTTVNPSTASHRVMAVRLTAELRTATPWTVLTDRIANNAANYPRLAVEGDGTVHLAWFDSRR